MPDGDPQITNQLIRSIVNLCSPQDSEEAENEAFDTACKAFSKCFTYPDDNSTSIDFL